MNWQPRRSTWGWAIKRSSYTAILDACVLYPAPLRDLLMELAAGGLYRAKWTERIHEEWMGSLMADRTDLSRQQLERTRDLMNRAVPDCLVAGYERLVPSLDLPDENDRHILAAAIVSASDAIVTFNLRDFPKDRLAGFGLEPLHPRRLHKPPVRAEHRSGADRGYEMPCPTAQPNEVCSPVSGHARTAGAS